MFFLSKRFNLLFLFILFFGQYIFAQAQAQNPTYDIYVTNEKQIDSKTYQFDVYLLSTGTIPLEVANIQFGLGFDTSITNGGTLSFSYVTGSSELNARQTPVNVTLSPINQVAMIEGVAYRFANQLAKPGPGMGNATIISDKKSDCSAPGTRIGTYQLVNTVDFKTNSRCNHIFSSDIGSGRTRTIINGYVNKMNVTAEGKKYNYNTENTCGKNIVLNPQDIPKKKQ